MVMKTFLEEYFHANGLIDKICDDHAGLVLKWSFYGGLHHAHVEDVALLHALQLEFEPLEAFLIVTCYRTE